MNILTGLRHMSDYLSGFADDSGSKTCTNTRGRRFFFFEC